MGSEMCIRDSGEHLPSHMPSSQRAWLSSSPLAKSLLTLRHHGSIQQAIHPEDTQQLLDAGFRYVVVDPSVFSGSNAAGLAAAHSQFFEALWGAPLQTSLNGGTWRIEALDETVTVDIGIPKQSDRIRRRSTR